jgi:hypothetical protein
MTVTWEVYTPDARPVSPSDIAAMEDRLGIAIPKDLAQAIVAYRGYTPEPGGVRLGDVAASVFGPILIWVEEDHPDQTYSVNFAINALLAWFGQANERDLLVFPFADDTANGLYCLDYRQNRDIPNYVFIDLTYAPDERGGITTLGTSFGEVLGRLF